MSLLTSVVAMVGGAMVGGAVSAPLANEDSSNKQHAVAQAVDCVVSTVVAICLDNYLQKHFDN